MRSRAFTLCSTASFIIGASALPLSSQGTVLLFRLVTAHVGDDPSLTSWSPWLDVSAVFPRISSLFSSSAAGRVFVLYLTSSRPARDRETLGDYNLYSAYFEWQSASASEVSQCSRYTPVIRACAGAPGAHQCSRCTPVLQVHIGVPGAHQFSGCTLILESRCGGRG